MNKNILVAFLIAFIILFTYPKYLKMISHPSAEKQVIQLESPEDTEFSPKLAEDVNMHQEEIFIKDEKMETIENEQLRIVVSNRGAAISSIYLKEYNGGGEVTLYDVSDAGETRRDYIGEIRVLDEKGRFIEKYNTLYYNRLDSSRNDEIVYEAPVIEGLYIKKKIALDADDYNIKISFFIENTLEQEREITVELSSGLVYEVKRKYDKQYINSVVKSYDKVVVTRINKLIKEGSSLQNKVDWLAIEKKYFTIILKPFFNANSARVKHIGKNTLLGYILSEPIKLLRHEAVSLKSIYFAGPKHYKVLKAYGNNFEDILSRGFFGSIKTFMVIVLSFFYSIFHNYGIAIIVLTIIIKILFAPLTHKSFESMRKMQELQPQMKALQEKYKNEPQKLNKEIMGLYKQHKANPFSGCFPLLLQMPIFIALYQTLSQSVELRGAPFIWWIKDLSEPDRMFTLPFSLPVIGDSFNFLPLIMLVSMIWQQKLTPSTATSKEQERIMLLMPIMFGVIFYNLPSGLVLYWFVNNVLTISHQLIHRKLR